MSSSAKPIGTAGPGRSSAEPIGTAGPGRSSAEPIGTAGPGRSSAEPIGTAGPGRSSAEPIGTAGPGRSSAEPIGTAGPGRSSAEPIGTAGRSRRGTYSIVARDPGSGELGVAVQSHWFSVGPLVPWAQPGVGAVATQANIEIAYGPRTLEQLAAGATADGALAELLTQDSAARGRQVAVVDANGAIAVHTGESCMPYAGHVTGEQVSCQANLMANDKVWSSMLEAFAGATGSLTTRLLDALDAGEAAGGDVRGRQSAAILVVPASGNPWDTLISLRVEDHPEPLRELRRLVALHDAYVLAGRGDWLVSEERYDDAAKLYQQAAAMAPDNHELRFWSGLGAASIGEVESGVAQVREAIAQQPGWADLLPRLSPEDAPAAAIVHARLTEPPTS